LFRLTYEANKLTKELLPTDIGIYAWIDKRTMNVVYVGTALGRRGLRQRIWYQHLNPNYLETRKEKFARADFFQLEHPIYKDGRVALDKSSFRKSIARRYLLRSGMETVNYIKEHYLCAFSVYNPDQEDLLRLHSEQYKRDIEVLYQLRA